MATPTSLPGWGSRGTACLALVNPALVFREQAPPLSPAYSF